MQKKEATSKNTSNAKAKGKGKSKGRGKGKGEGKGEVRGKGKGKGKGYRVSWGGQNQGQIRSSEYRGIERAGGLCPPASV